MQTEEGLLGLFQDGSNLAAVQEVGYRKKIQLCNNAQMQQALKANQILRVLPELSQFREGLKVCGVLSIIQTTWLRTSPWLEQFHSTKVSIKYSPNSVCVCVCVCVSVCVRACVCVCVV